MRCWTGGVGRARTVRWRQGRSCRTVPGRASGSRPRVKATPLKEGHEMASVDVQRAGRLAPLQVETIPGYLRPDYPLSVLQINGDLVIRPRRAGAVPPDVQRLTDREREVLALVAEGHSNKSIGANLCISERTVKNHLTYIMTKLRAMDRTHAVVTAVRLGWLAI
ncbi:MAG: response regulator transcription factor [Chloroflexi bacterium]|nr:response regulator transcription factor [Chloroflexota bacterium]